MKSKLILFFGTIGAMLGGLDTLLTMLLGLMVIDVITGLMIAFSAPKTFKFQIMYKGGCKKIFMLLMVAAAVLINQLLEKKELD